MSRRTQTEDFDTRIDALRERIKDSNDQKVLENVFDTRTLMSLYTLASKGVIDALGGAVSTGKEANIFSAIVGDKDLVIKIYRITTGNFKAMQDYLLGDPRFGSVKGTKRAVISAWTRKEFRNLSRAEEVGIRVPHPIAMKDNLLIMDMVKGENGPAPQLKDVDLSPEDARKAFDKIAEYISVLYNQAELVHADLSEFNVLYDGEPVIIDMGQSVTLDHPMARKFLDRDVANIARYFQKKYGLGSEEEIWSRVRAEKAQKDAQKDAQKGGWKAAQNEANNLA
ncbi:MAG TPA: serine protein kinase RIO [Methanotrichaceae archaeon]|nr:serine protein kinase RIO [Methanotrichaceae archaeon]